MTRIMTPDSVLGVWVKRWVAAALPWDFIDLFSSVAANSFLILVAAAAATTRRLNDLQESLVNK